MGSALSVWLPRADSDVLVLALFERWTLLRNRIQCDTLESRFNARTHLKWHSIVVGFIFWRINGVMKTYGDSVAAEWIGLCVLFAFRFLGDLIQGRGAGTGVLFRNGFVKYQSTSRW